MNYRDYVQESFDLYINGQWVPASDGATFKAYNPANGDVLASCAEATKEDVDRAVAAGHEALKSWKKYPLLIVRSCSFRLPTSLMLTRKSWL